jgi:hypothetical protein
MSAPKRLKLRLSGSARKSQKWFRDTPMFKFQAVLARTQPFLSRSVEKRGDHSNSNAEKWSIIMQFAVDWQEVFRTAARSLPFATCPGQTNRRGPAAASRSPLRTGP